MVIDKGEEEDGSNDKNASYEKLVGDEEVVGFVRKASDTRFKFGKVLER